MAFSWKPIPSSGPWIPPPVGSFWPAAPKAPKTSRIRSPRPAPRPRGPISSWPRERSRSRPLRPSSMKRSARDAASVLRSALIRPSGWTRKPRSPRSPRPPAPGAGPVRPNVLFGAHPRHFTDQQIYAQIDAITEEAAETKAVAFCCNWCSYAGADFAGVSRMQYPAPIRIIRTMCSGRISTDFI